MEKELSRVVQRVLRCFEHVERMDELRIANEMRSTACVEGLHGSPVIYVWMDGVNVALNDSGPRTRLSGEL